ncbi:MAG: hypothetical protein KI792_10665 [Alphaproteobacteria bacterium]|nr:hypothetical protein [Alphaproteobacteria bacterium SS10]
MWGQFIGQRLSRQQKADNAAIEVLGFISAPQTSSDGITSIVHDDQQKGLARKYAGLAAQGLRSTAIQNDKSATRLLGDLRESLDYVAKARPQLADEVMTATRRRFEEEAAEVVQRVFGGDHAEKMTPDAVARVTEIHERRFDPSPLAAHA